MRCLCGDDRLSHSHEVTVIPAKAGIHATRLGVPSVRAEPFDRLRTGLVEASINC
jgi:hypothetical protein